MMSVENIFVNPQSKREEADAARRHFLSAHGDQMTLLNVYNEYKGVKGNAEWCYRSFINKRSLQTVCCPPPPPPPPHHPTAALFFTRYFICRY